MIINAANAAAVTNLLPDPLVVPVVPFALYPGRASNNLFDYNNEINSKMLNCDISGLDIKFDINKDGNLSMFIELVKERVMIYNWARIINMPDNNCILRSLLTNINQINAADVKAHSSSYMLASTKDDYATVFKQLHFGIHQIEHPVQSSTVYRKRRPR